MMIWGHRGKYLDENDQVSLIVLGKQFKQTYDGDGDGDVEIWIVHVNGYDGVKVLAVAQAECKEAGANGLDVPETTVSFPSPPVSTANVGLFQHLPRAFLTLTK